MATTTLGAGIKVPCDVDTERAVLGMFMVDVKTLKKVSELSENDFCYLKNKEVFNAIKDLVAVSSAIDIITVNQKLQDRKSNIEPDYLLECNEIYSGAWMVEDYVKNLKEMSIKRDIQRFAVDLSQKVKTDVTAEELIHDMSIGLQDITAKSINKNKGDIIKIGDYLSEFVDNISGLNNMFKNAYLPTGFKSFDSVFSGLRRGDLIYVAGRPSAGKSTVTAKMAMHLAVQNIPVYYGSYEISKNNFILRLLAMLSEVDSRRITYNFANEFVNSKVRSGLNKIYQKPFYLSSRPATISKVREYADMIREKEGLSPVIFLDRIELIPEKEKKDETRNHYLGRISQQLVSLANEFYTPVVCLSQLSRAIEHRADKKPILSDLRDSGSLEQDAKMVIFIHRDKEKNKEQAFACEPLESYLIVAKNMDGPIGDIPIEFQQNIPSFIDFANWEEKIEKEGLGGYDQLSTAI